MKCEVHEIEMEYAGEDPFGGDVWFCQMCADEEDYYVWHNDAWQQDHSERFPELFEDELDDEG